MFSALILLCMLLVAALVFPWANKAKIPTSLVLVVVGFVGSEWTVVQGFDTGLRWQQFHGLVFYLLLPVLVFQAAMHINGRQLLQQILAILLLSTPMMLIATFISAAVLFWGIGYPDHFPWLAALLTGAILSATDPAAVIELFKRSGVSDRFMLLIDGESLFNDATAIVLFSLFVSLLLLPDQHGDFVSAVKRFLIIFLGGLGVGACVAGVLGACYFLVKGVFPRMVFMLFATYAGFILSEHYLQVSGVICVLVAGLVFGELLRNHSDEQEQQQLSAIWQFNSQLANALLFILLGMTVTAQMFIEQWLAMLLGIGAVLIARALGLLVTAPLINCLPNNQLTKDESVLLYWGGMRGAVTIALALSLPLEIEAWFTIQSIAYGVVLFSLCVQATTAPYLVKSLKLERS